MTEAAQIELKKEDIEKMNAALEEDPTLFDYGDYYDEMQSKMQAKKKPVTGNATYGYGITVPEMSKSKGSSGSAQQSRYIDGLLAKARERDVERELVLERQRHKENQKYEEMYGETESFVTPEYMLELELKRKQQEEIDRRDAQSGSVTNFYANLRSATVGNNSEAFSADVPAPSKVSPTFSDSKSPKVPISDEDDAIHRISEPGQPEQDSESESNIQKPSQPRASLLAVTTRKPRRHTDQMIEDAKERYRQRQLQRTIHA